MINLRKTYDAFRRGSASACLILAIALGNASADGERDSAAPCEGHDHHHHDGRHYPQASLLSLAPSANRLATNAALALAPAPEGVTDIRFAEFFKPVGAAGLEFSDRLKGLDGKRVRLLGYMVRTDKPKPGLFMISPLPAQCHETEMGLADDLPSTIVHVSTTTDSDKVLPHTPGLLLLTGTLELGPREAADGRIASVRMKLDPKQSMELPLPATESISTNAARAAQACAAAVAPQTN